MLHFGYDIGLRLLRATTPLLRRGEGKVARGLRGRDLQRGRLETWARDARTDGRPLIWLHAPSVGEGLQARAVARAIRQSHPETQIAFTYFSPSAEGWAEKLVEAGDVDVEAYMPWDTLTEMGRVLDALQPSVVAFTKTEVWPGLARAGRRRGIPLVLVAATLPQSAGRLRLPARWLLRSTFRSLVRVFAIADEDGGRFAQLGVRAARIRVTGDPGIDSALDRVASTDTSAPWYRALEEFGGRPSVVAGSTWGPDEEVLLPALEIVAEARGQRPGLIVAPHEPDESHLSTLEARLDAGGWRHARLSAVEARGHVGGLDAVVVDRVGILAHLYAIGSVGYVGGGFGSDGLHSVLEPAAAGRPVLHGPRFENSRAAHELGLAGGARVADDSRSLADHLDDWLFDDGARDGAGRQALDWLDRHRGAAARTAEALDIWF